VESIRTDVVIVGAGPAGSSCAYFLAKGGADVLLVDKKSFPREKCCGDGIFPGAVLLLQQMGLEDWLKNFYRIDYLRAFSPDGSSIAAKMLENISFPVKHGYVIPRDTLDNKLRETAISAGAGFLQIEAKLPLWEGETVAGIIGAKDGKEIQIEAKLVIAADGSLRPFSTKLTGHNIAYNAICLRAYFENVGNLDNCLFVFFKKELKRGYAWVFPTSQTTANVGLGVHLSQQSRNKDSMPDLFNRFVDSQRDSQIAGLGEARQISKVRGFPLQMNLGRINPSANGVLIIGDAAGLISPVSGAGIAFALESGKLASQVALSALEDNDLSGQRLSVYAHDLKRKYALDWKIGSLLTFFLQYPSVMNRVVSKAGKDQEISSQLFGIWIGLIRPHKFFSPKSLVKLLL